MRELKTEIPVHMESSAHVAEMQLGHIKGSTRACLPIADWHLLFISWFS